MMKSTFIVDKAEQPKARLSWYHPDDTVGSHHCPFLMQEAGSVHMIVDH